MSGRKGVASLCLAIALVAGAVSAIGVFARGDGSTASATSIRGEQFEYATTGVYAFNAERVVAEGVGWDAVTLAFAVPALLLALPGIRRGSQRAQLFALGILAYFFYQYFMYSVFWAFGPLFVPFVALYSASAAAIVWIVSGLDVTTLPQVFSSRFPRKGIAVFSAVMSFVLVAMWSARIAAGYRGDWIGAGLFGMPTMTVQAMDLGIVVPVALATAVLAWRKRPWGYLLAPVFAVKGLTMAGAICAMLISAAIVEGSLETGPFAVFFLATAVSGYLAWRSLSAMKPALAERARGVLEQGGVTA